MMPLAMVESAHIAALHYRLRETPRAANRALSVLSKMFSLAAAWGLAAEGTNPCRGVRKYKEKKRERFLTRDEYRRLGQALGRKLRWKRKRGSRARPRPTPSRRSACSCSPAAGSTRS